MCGICRTVNCIRRRLFGGCGCNNGCYHTDTYNDNGCNEGCSYGYNRGCANSRYAEPKTNVVCANQHSECYKPCCGNDDCNCKKHYHHDDCCD